ncbi:MAG TPA: hypothetical protein VIM58_09935 [Candidatus Methylacidiphilales bacterium]
MKPSTAPVLKVTGAFSDMETAAQAIRTLRKTGYRSGQIRVLRRLLPQDFLRNLPHPAFARYLRHLAGVGCILVVVHARNIDDAKTILEGEGARVADNRYFTAPLHDGGDRPVFTHRWRE